MLKMLQPAILASLGLLLVLSPGPTMAQEQLAVVENLGDTLVFHPLVEFAQLVLTVTGPCDFQYRQVVTQGEAVFRLDPTTIDGAYTYDLVREEPIDPAIIEILQQARKTFDEETPRQLCRDGKLPGPPTSQTEGFLVFEGRIIYDPGAIEKSAARSTVTPATSAVSSSPEAAQGALRNVAAADFVIIDDLIVDGSACIGFDCVNGESFGFDTVRLKENNLRIKFDDTSTAASFPRNDWQLTANDSANGGASKFSIDDISGSRTPFTVEANARSHSLYVDDGGRIGSRTSTPSTEIHTVDGDTPTLRLQQDGSSGFAPQTWDVAGNETNFFIRDVTNGSTLPFRIRPGAPSSSIFIDVDGDVGIGTSSPDTPFEVVRTTSGGKDMFTMTNNGAVRFILENTANSTWTVRNVPVGGSSSFFINTVPAPTNAQLELQEDGDLFIDGSLVASSSRLVKTGFELLDPAEVLSRLARLDIPVWSYIADTSGSRHIGPVAEDFFALFGLGPDDKHIAPSDQAGVALAAIQGLHRKLAEKDQAIAELEAAKAGLEERLTALEELVRKLVE